MGSDKTVSHLSDEKDVEASAPNTAVPPTNTFPVAPVPTTPISLEEIPPSVLAMSNLRCPSPPPILANSNRTPVSKTAATASVSPVQQTQRETIPAGGAILNEKEKVSSPSQPSVKLENVTSPLLSPTLNHLVGHNNDSLTSLDYALNPPTTSSHHKSPSVHAHFYVDETLKASKIRSRSASNSGSDVGGVSGAGVAAAASALAAPLPSFASSTGVNNLHIPNSTSVKPKSPELVPLEKFTTIGNIDSTLSGDNLASAATVKGTDSSNFNTPRNLSPALPASAFSNTVSPSTGEQNANIDPRLPQDDGKIHVLLGVCGALSTVKIKLIINKLFEIYTPEKIAIQLILTSASEHFIPAEILHILENVKKVRVWRDSDEWHTWKTRSDPVLHIELRRWADILIVSPLTANTLSKIALGLCDNLLTNVIRAWNTAYPILLAPSMVSYAYSAITTKRQLRLISEEMPWIEVLKPVEKIVGSYGDIGMGGMMDYNEIVNKIVLKLGGYPEEDEDEEDVDDKDNGEAINDDDDDDDDDDDEEEDDDEDEDEEVSPAQ